MLSTLIIRHSNSDKASFKRSTIHAFVGSDNIYGIQIRDPVRVLGLWIIWVFYKRLYRLCTS